MMSDAALKRQNKFNAVPILRSIFTKAAAEQSQTDEMLRQLGWDSLPIELKIEIRDDIKGYIDELEGRYCTHCHFVQRRRESVDFWVNSYLDGLCTLDTAVASLKVKTL